MSEELRREFEQRGIRKAKVGGFDVTTLLAGTRAVEEPQNIFGMNVSEEEFAEASEKANIPADKTQFFFTPTVVNTGSDLVLFDTGLNAEGTGAANTPSRVNIDPSAAMPKPLAVVVRNSRRKECPGFIGVVVNLLQETRPSSK